jgi:hypothetical protein
MNQLYFKRTQGNPITQVLGPTPWTYTNSSGSLQILTVSNGALVTIELNTGFGFILQIPISGVFLLFPDQQIRINYVITPPNVTMTQL